MGVPFNRTPEGLLDFRRFGGTLHHRTAFAGATTGQQLLYALDEQVRRYESEGKVTKYEGWEFLSAVLDGNHIARGICAIDLRSMEVRTFPADAIIMTSLSPGEQVIRIVRDELVNVLGKDTARVKFASQPPTVVLMAGLQGSGKTTTSGKLAHWFKNGGHRPLLVSVDVYRPAAREQLKVVAQAIKAQIYQGEVSDANTSTVERLAKEARREAINSGCDVLIVDTAGRLHIDDQLMEEMQSLKKLLNPSEILFVADAMTGQDAVRSADEFHKKLSLTGVVLTKMDGDARGGAALSIRQVTGAPIKFIGVGEKYDALEPFHPDRIVSRILGMNAFILCRNALPFGCPGAPSRSKSRW